MSDHRAFNTAVRRAAGRQSRIVLPGDTIREGCIGIGRGGAAGAPRVVDDFAARFNSEVRLTAGLLRGRYHVDDLIANR